MRIVLDTNVIIAAFSTRGLCAELFEKCFLEHSIYSSEFILDECAEKFHKKIKLPSNKIQDAISYLREVSQIIEPVIVDVDVFEDVNDLAIIGTAIAANADVLVTGDKALLSLKHIVCDQESFLIKSKLASESIIGTSLSKKRTLLAEDIAFKFFESNKIKRTRVISPRELWINLGK